MNNMLDWLDFDQFTGSYFCADWKAKGIGSLITTRRGGVSTGQYTSLNVGDHVGDDPLLVKQNRQIVASWLPVPIIYLNQVHGSQVVEITAHSKQNITADASINRDGQVACAVMTADCLPILLCSPEYRVVSAIHGGWRSLCADIIEKTIVQMNVPSASIHAYLAPAISVDAFEVGHDVYTAFTQGSLKNQVNPFFNKIDNHHYLADLYGLAKAYLQYMGIIHISGGGFCTVMQKESFFSYRRDGQTGRILSAVWLDRSIE